MEPFIDELQRAGDLESIRQVAVHLFRSNTQLLEQISKLKAERNEVIASQQQTLDDRLIVLNRILFGKKSEKRSKPEVAARHKDNGNVLLFSQPDFPAPIQRTPDPLPAEEIIHEMGECLLAEEARRRGLPNRWRRLEGLYEQSQELTIIERKIGLTIHKREKYLNEGSPKENPVIVTAPGPKKLLPGCCYSVDFAVEVASDKYVMHLPLERQSRKIESEAGMKIYPKTLSNLCAAIAKHLGPVSELIRKDILAENIAVHCDESPWPIQSAKDDDGYMWVVSNRAGSSYQFEPTRSGKVIAEILKKYSGPVVCDGYSGYNRLKELSSGITVAHCWSHARRKFFDIQQNYPETEKILDLIDELFAIEREATSFKGLKKLRKNRAGPVVEKIKNWLFEYKPKARAETAFSNAIQYTLNHWEGLTAFLSDVRIPLSNNDAERAVRHAVMGRKNFYGSQTINGADTAATLYTVVESCKRVALDPKSFIKMAILRNIQSLPPITPLAYAKQQASAA